jgi:hypothetical protein
MAGAGRRLRSIALLVSDIMSQLRAIEPLAKHKHRETREFWRIYKSRTAFKSNIK